MFNHFSLLPFYSQDNFKNKYLTPKYKQPAELKNNGKKGFLNILVWNNKEANNDYKVLAISDSFLAQYLRYLAVSFNQTFHLFFGGGIDFGKEDIRNYLLSNRPDIIIVGSTERFLHRFLKLEFPKKSQKED